MIRRLFFLLICGLLAACGGESDTDLPTVFQVPVETAVTPAPPNEEVTPLPVTAAGGAATLPASWTPTQTSTASPTLTVTASMTITDTPSRTPTHTLTPTLEPRALNSFLAVQQSATVPPTSPFLLTQIAGGGRVATSTGAAPVVVLPPTLPVQCQYTPPGQFEALFLSDPTIVTEIGCPVGTPPTVTVVNGATQPFQQGTMVWVNTVPPQIYVLYDDGTFQRFDDTYTAGVDPESGNLTPPEGLIEPVRGFGKVWRDFGLQTTLGWATAGETPVNLEVLDFAQGRMIALPGQIVTLLDSGDSGLWR